MKEFLVYSAARFAVFAACTAAAFAIFWLLRGDEEVPVLWPLLLGAITSVMVSAWLLRDLREQFAAKVQGRAERMVEANQRRESADDPDSQP